MQIKRNPVIIKGTYDLHMEIGESGYARTDPLRWRVEGVRMPFSRLYLVKAGEGWLRTDGQTVVMRPGYAYFIPAGLPLSYGCDDYVEKLYFHVRLTKPDGYDLAEGLSCFAECPMEEGWLDRMIAFYQSDRWMDALALQGGLYEMLSRLLQQYPVKHQPIPLYSPLTEQTMRYVQEHLSVRLSSGEIAAALFVSQSALSRTFRQETGKTIRQYVEDMVFSKAQKQLLETDRSLGRISETLGFCDMFFFPRRFRQRYGEPPSVYRKRLQAESMLRLPVTEAY